MAQAKKPEGKDSPKSLHFDISTGLKRVLGRELITDDEVAIFEMVKNSFDAGASRVKLFFSADSILIADNGGGMSYEDLTQKWLFVAYSDKRVKGKDFRDVAADRGHLAGSKGIGRFSSDRLGRELTLQTRPKSKAQGIRVHKLVVDWQRFERNDKEHFEKIPVVYSDEGNFEFPKEFGGFDKSLKHGTVIEIKRLRATWNRDRILDLKAALAKLINPFGDRGEHFGIEIIAPDEVKGDKDAKRKAAQQGEQPLEKDIANGPVGNLIFSELQEKTTFISVAINGETLNTTLTDRGEVVYKIREPNPYSHLADADFSCIIYYLNQSAKVTFARRVGLPSIQFGSVFLFRRGFRVYPIGEDHDDWFGFNRRKQQGYSRFLGTREIIGRVDVYGSDEDFQETSSRNQGLIETPAVKQLHRAVMDHCLKRLEKYVVPVSWKIHGDGDTDDLSRLLTDPGRAKVSTALADLIDNDQIELIEYSKRLVNLVNERSTEFENSIVSMQVIAEKTGDKALVARLNKARQRFDELRKSEAEARKIADRERERALKAEGEARLAKGQAEIDRRRAHFMESAVDLDSATILNLHHQVTIYAVDIAQQIENLLTSTAGQKSISRETLLSAMEQIAFLNRKVLAIARFAPRANFKLDSEMIDADLAEFITEYIEEIAKYSGSARMKVEVHNTDGAKFKLKFNPIDAAIIVDNLINNSRRAKATKVTFTLASMDRKGLLLRVADNGRGLVTAVDRKRIFEMGYTTTQGSGLGLYHVRQVLAGLSGSIELESSQAGKGATFLIKMAGGSGGK